MLTFVVPLKSPQASKSWEHVTKLYARCVKSLCNQTSAEFRVIVVCNQKPNIEFNHPHITYLEVDFLPPPETDLLSKGYTDKGRKILKGLIYAQQFAPTHTMAVDADDCVSKHLAELVKTHPHSNGWFINQGYKYPDGGKFIYKKRQEFYRMCGTCNIIKNDLNPLPENPEYNRGYGYYKFYIDHEKVKNILAQQATPLAPLPFPGAVYILETGEHLFYESSKLKFSIFNRKVLNKSLQDEFSLYPI